MARANADKAVPIDGRRKGSNSFAGFCRRLFRVRLAPLAVVVLAVVVFCAVFARVISPYDPITYQSYANANQGPSAAHWFGTDYIGRDTLSRLIYGSRISLQVGGMSVLMGLLLGVSIGLVAGYFRGMLDAVLMRLMDSIWAFPSLMLALAISSVLGAGVVTVTIAIAVVNVPYFARITRASTLSTRELEYVTAARAIGTPDRRIIVRHILPNISAPIIVQASLAFATAIITEAALSFLGVGVQPPTPSWGIVLRNGYQYLQTNPSLALFPGMAIFFTVLALNFLGDGLRTALDPKLWQRGQS